MSSSNRELVEFFLSHRLSQRNHPSSLLRPQDARQRTEEDQASSSASNGSVFSGSAGRSQSPRAETDPVKSALLDSADEFELLFKQAFSDLSSQLDITPDTAYHSFKSVMDEVFKDGVNWGRIVGLFAFGGVLCVECVEKDMSELVSRIADWMTMYLDENINFWIESQGGWEYFAEIFGRGAASEARRSREKMTRWLLVGVALLAGVLIGVGIAKRQ
ncbi:bcl-2-like protein 1 [Salarias fasciatus]|uniref:Bcl-2-like protein 1 n=1 Tax=Salarias fasciatus TaxID=181472 RepID=A0A672JL90_SALFA|nr:bcl-2-like protein 1 [Salarias fasciatus]